MSQLRLISSAVAGEFDKAVRDIYRPIAEAGTAAIRKVGDDVKRDARAGIAMAGFGKKWRNALRVDVYPKRGSSARAAAHIYHKIPYAAVFEHGAQIRGKPMLWIPMSHAPKRAGGKRLTAAQYVRTVGPLHTIKRAGKPPLLAGKVRANATGAITTGRLRSGQRMADKKGSRAVRSIPLFVGVDRVSIRKRFNIFAAIEKARRRLAEYYLANLKD